MTNCEYMIYTKSKSCAACTGWHCTAKGRKKKIGDTTICTDDELRLLCPRYIPSAPITKTVAASTEERVSDLSSFELKPKAKPIFNPTNPPPLATLCPYLTPPPPGVQTCCGMYCSASGQSLRTGTQCKSRPTWMECRHKAVADRRKAKRLARA